MSASISRRQFLRGDLSGSASALRPPWALAEAQFLERCDRCGECIIACETGILQAGDGGYPQPNFFHGECTFCARCVAACTSGALARRAGAPWTLKARIADSCLAQRGIVCQVCADPCATRAIRFPPRLATAALPVLDPAACNGCGACVAACPVQAVHMTTEVQ